MSTMVKRGKIIYTDEYGHVCTCTETNEYGECEGHPSGPWDRMGETVFCDGSCQHYETYLPTVTADRATATESGSYWYSCSRCGAGTWSGC